VANSEFAYPVADYVILTRMSCCMYRAFIRRIFCLQHVINKCTIYLILYFI